MNLYTFFLIYITYFIIYKTKKAETLNEESRRGKGHGQSLGDAIDHQYPQLFRIMIATMKRAA